MFGRAAQLFTDSGELLRAVTPRSTRGHGLVFLARPADGLAEATAALLLARDLDTPEGQAYALWHRSRGAVRAGPVRRGADRRRRRRCGSRTARPPRLDGHRIPSDGHRGAGRGRLDDAGRAFADSAAAAGDSLSLFASWAAARSALVALAGGNPARAEPFVDRALALGPPLGHYEARLAEVELAAARSDHRCAQLATTALKIAGAGGHTVSLARLAELASKTSPVPPV